jgi:hypothetical protein
VAIVQISRITQRQGLLEDLPQPLAGAEFGWTLDQRRLFIGNGEVAEGAPVVGNTEILTEFTDVLSLAAAYTYKGDAAGYTVQTGPTSGDPVAQSIQSRLDSYAVSTVFGAVGDGATDVTSAVNRALFQMFCVQANTQIRRSLFFPAGTYIITDTIKLPPFAKLYGEGADSTVFLFEVQEWAANTAYDNGVLVKVESVTPGVFNYYRSAAEVPPTGILVTNTTYWDSTTLPEYVIETADSLQQTGVNIGTNGAVAPRNLEISGITFQTTEVGNHKICSINQLQQGYFDSCNFVGPLQEIDLDTNIDNFSCVVFNGTAEVPPTQITLDKCKFIGATYAVSTNQYVKGITISNGQMNTLYQGVYLGDTTVVNGGPTGVRIVHNEFDKIFAEGIVIENCGLNASAYNTFYDVGNNFFGVAVPQTPIISINTDNNLSIGDLFQRNNTQALTQPRIQIYNTDTATIPLSVGYSGSSKFQVGSYSREAGQQEVLEDAATTQALFAIDSSASVASGGFSSFNMNYTIKREGTSAVIALRTGVLSVQAADGYVLNFTDDYSENNSTGITLSVTQAGDDITVAYTASSTGFDGTIYYSITHFA